MGTSTSSKGGGSRSPFDPEWLSPPEGGAGGGCIIATGTPEQVAQHAISHTGRFLAPLLARDRAAN